MKGSLVCVGVGMTLGAHLAPRARNFIVQSDVVFVLASDPLVELWIQRMHSDVRSLQPYYGQHLQRAASYRAMVDAMLAQVEAGQRVCSVFYGHPGVFARVPHDAIGAVRASGLPAHMEPAISAEDCLYADLAIDPGNTGCQHFEAAQFVLYRRQVDAAGWLVLWQAGVGGPAANGTMPSSHALRVLLVERLLRDYPPAHPVVLYEAATLPINTPRRDTVALRSLSAATLAPQTTLVLQPARPLEPDRQALARARALDGGRQAATVNGDEIAITSGV